MEAATQVMWGHGGGAAAAPVTLPQRSAFPLTLPTAALVLFNLLDGVFTTAFLELGRAEELNPFMRWAYEAEPLIFMMLKMICVHAGVLVLAYHQNISAARWVLRSAVGVYALLVVYHLGFLAWVMRA